MPKWLVRLKGERFDLEDLPSLLRSPELNATEDNGFYYLQSSEFDSLTSADEVRERGIALIKILNGAAKLYRDNFRDVAEDGITRVENDGSRHHYVYLEGGITPRAKVSAQVTVITSNGSQPAVGQPSPLESWFRLAQKHKPVADALHFYREDSWINLYKVYEVIIDDVGGEHIVVSNGWVSGSYLSRFTQTAQSRAALGDYARHASQKYKPPAQPMPLSEAKSLVKSILMKWLTTKS